MLDADPLLNMHEDDGYRIRPGQLGPELWLELAFYLEGQRAAGFGTAAAGGVELAGWLMNDWRARGARARLQPVLEALCRYFNTGGEWGTLEAALTAFKAAVPGGRYLGPYAYFDGGLTTEGCWEHLFVRDDTGPTGVLWSEGQYVEPRTTEDLLAQEDHQDEGDSAAALERQPCDGLPGPQ